MHLGCISQFFLGLGRAACDVIVVVVVGGGVSLGVFNRGGGGVGDGGDPGPLPWAVLLHP